MSPIPDDELISAYLDDELSREDRLRAEQLLLDRADLRRLFDELRGLRQGLRSLPKFSLGDEFSSAVLQQAERSVLQGDETEKGKSPIAPDAAAVPGPTSPTIAQASQQQQARDVRPVVVADRSRALRPVIYALTTVAAALAIMFYQQGVFDRRETAMKDAPHGAEAGKASLAPNAPVSGRSDGDRAERDNVVLESAAPRAKNGFSADGGAFATDRNAAPASNAVTSNAMLIPKQDIARGAAPTDAPGSAHSIENKFVADKTASTKADAAPQAPAAAITVPTPTVTLGAVGEGTRQQVDALAADGAMPASVEMVALNDNQRLDILARNLAKARRADGTVDAYQLNDLAATDLPRQQQVTDGRVLADAAQRKQQAFNYGNESQNLAGWNAAGGLVVLNIDCSDREVIDNDFKKVLGPLNDLTKTAELVASNNSGVAVKESRGVYGSYGLSTTEAEREKLASNRNGTADSSGGGAGFGGRPDDSELKRVAGASGNTGLIGNQGSNGQQGPAGRAGAGGQLGPIGRPGEIAAKAGGERREADLRAGEKADLKKQSGDVAGGVEYEYVYVVAKREELQSIVNLVRAESKRFNIVSVDVATPELAAEKRRRSLKSTDLATDLKSQAPASVANAPAAAPGLPSTAGLPSVPAAKGAGQSEPLAAAKPTAAAAPTLPKLAAPAGGALAGTAPSAPATPVPGSTPAPPPSAAAPSTAAPSTAGPPAGLMTATQPTATQPVAGPASTQRASDQPIASSALQQKSEQRVESQGYGDQRRGYSQSRWQRSNDRQVYERLFNERQLEASRSNSYFVSNPVAEKSPTADKSKEAGKLGEMTKKMNDVAGNNSVGDNSAKVADPAGVPTAAGAEGMTTQSQSGNASAPPAAAKAAPTGVARSSATPVLNSNGPNLNGSKPNEPKPVAAKPSDSETRTARLAKDEADGKLRDSQAGGGGPSSRIAGGGFVPAPPMLPAQQQASPTQQAAPEDVLGKIGGVQQAPPLVQQAMPPLGPNRIRGVAQDEQAAAQNALQLTSELPPDYQEALFVFRVVKSKEGGKGEAVEADAARETKPAKQ